MELKVIQRGRYVEGRCEFIDRCPDIEELRDSQSRGIVDEKLEDQFHELCTSGGYCSIRESYLGGRQ